MNQSNSTNSLWREQFVKAVNELLCPKFYVDQFGADGLGTASQDVSNTEGRAPEQCTSDSVSLKEACKELLGQAKGIKSPSSLWALRETLREGKEKGGGAQRSAVYDRAWQILSASLDYSSGKENLEAELKQSQWEDVIGRMTQHFEGLSGAQVTDLERGEGGQAVGSSQVKTKSVGRDDVSSMREVLETRQDEEAIKKALNLYFVWKPLACSLLSGEFLLDPEYSNALRDLASKIRKRLVEEEAGITDYLHPVLPYIYQLCRELCEACVKMRLQLEVGKSTPYRKIFVLDDETHLYGWSYIGGSDCYEAREAKYFYEITHRLISMTTTDVCYIVDGTVVRELYGLHSWAKRCETKRASFVAPPSGKTGESEAILESIRAKSFILLAQSFCRLSLVQDGDRKDLIDWERLRGERGRINAEALKGCRYYSLRKTSFDFIGSDDARSGDGSVKKILSILLEECDAYDLIRVIRDLKDSRDERDRDVESYDAYVKKSRDEQKLWSRFFEGKEVLELVNEVEKDLQSRKMGLEEAYPSDLERQERERPYVPVNVLSYLVRQLKEQKKEEEREKGAGRAEKGMDAERQIAYVDAMGFLLKELQVYLRKFRLYTCPYSMRFDFANSFYRVQKSKRAEEKGEKMGSDGLAGASASSPVEQAQEQSVDEGLEIFIASYGNRPVNLALIESEIYASHHRRYQVWMTDAVKASNEEAQHLRKELRGKQEEWTNALTQQGQALERFTENNTKFEQEMRNESEKIERAWEQKVVDLSVSARKEAISILSIFSAVLLFVSSSISAFKFAQTIWDYIIMVGSSYLFVAAITGFLYFKKYEREGGEEPEASGRTYLGCSMLAAVLIIGLALVGKYCVSDDNSAPPSDSLAVHVNSVVVQGSFGDAAGDSLVRR